MWTPSHHGNSLSDLEENVNGNLFDLAKKRTSWLWKWAKRGGELEKEEHLLKECMPEHLRVFDWICTYPTSHIYSSMVYVYHIGVVHSMCTYLFGQFRP